MRGFLSVVLIGVLLTGSVVSQISPVFGEPKAFSQNELEGKNESILEFRNGVVLLASSTTTICHVPPGNHNNAHWITIGTSSLTAHLNHGDKATYCQNETSQILEFSSDNIETNSDTLSKVKKYMNEIILETSSESNVGPAVSKIAGFHKLFAHEDKEIKKDFQKAFLEFIKKIKEITGNSHGVSDKKILNDLGKAAIKLNSQIEKDERKENHKNKIKTAINLAKEKEELQEIRNQISMAKINYLTDTDEFEALVDSEKKLLSKVMISEAKSNGEKITIEKIMEISKKSTEQVDNNHKTIKEKGNSDNNKEKGNIDKNKGKGSNEKSDKSNKKSDKKSQKSSVKAKGKSK